MKKTNSDSTSVVLYKPMGLAKVGISLQVTEKILFERAEYYFNMGFVSLNSSDLDSVNKNFSEEILNNPQFLLDNKFDCRIKSPDDYVKAVNYFSKAISIFEAYTIAYNCRGLARYGLKEFSEAIGDFTKAIDIDPDYSIAYINRGIVKYDLKNYISAIEDFSKAIEIDPNYAFAYNNRGVAKYELKEFRSAIEDYSKAITIKPDYAFAYNNRGVAKYELMDYRAAIEDYLIAIAIDSNYTNAFKNCEEAQKALHDLTGNENNAQDFTNLIKPDET